MLPWYKEGLKFQCTGCGKCCTGSPGYVWISPEEIAEAANFLQISPEEFTRRYTRRIGNRLSLKENSTTYDCTFLKDKQCRIYGARPKQCRTFPWWKENLETQEEWDEAASRCEGINHPDSPLVSLEEIQKDLT